MKLNKLFAPDGAPSGGSAFVPPKVNTTNITPQMPSKPSEALLKTEFKMDPGLFKDDNSNITAENNRGEVTPVKVDAVAGNTNVEAPVQLPKQEGEVEEKPKIKSILTPPKGKVEAPKGEERVKTIAPPSKDKVVRDYNGLEPAVVSHLKQMSDQAYKYVRGLLDEKKQLESLKDSTFLQHPDAYTLSPEYKQTLTEVNLANQEASLWKSALLSCRSSKPFSVPTGFDKNGNFVMSQEIQPTDELELQLQQAFTNCNSVSQQTSQELETLKGQFGSRAQNDMKMIEAENTKRFAWVSDPSLLEYTVNIEGVGEKSLKQVKDDFCNLFPPYLRNNPATTTAANLFIALRIQDAQLKEALANQRTTETKNEEMRRAEPNSIVKPAEPPGEAIGGIKAFSLAGMPS